MRLLPNIYSKRVRFTKVQERRQCTRSVLPHVMTFHNNFITIRDTIDDFLFLIWFNAI